LWPDGPFNKPEAAFRGETEVSRRYHLRRSRVMVSAVAILGLVSLAAAVPGGSATASTPSPIKLMVISSVNNAASNNPQVFSAAQAAAHSINAKGGVNHHKIQILTCNDQYVPTVAAACARQAVSSHVVADSGTLSVLSDSINPILQQANIASVGSVPITDSDDTNPVSFPIEAALAMDYFADAQALADKGVTKIGFALLAATAALNLAAPVEQA
jgi:ABC-type branched-subunit amino acid transport system substrate-binding protein